MTAAPLTAITAAGALVGLGLFLILVHALPAPPALGPALRRLHPHTNTPPATTRTWLPRWWRIPHADLRLLGRNTEQYLLTVGLAALVALALPVMLTGAAVILHLPVSPAVPTGAALAAAGGAAWLAHRDVRHKAATARAEFVRATCTYIDLTAHQVLAGHGPIQSLTRAASVCHGAPYTRIRQALQRAELELTPPWEQMTRLAHDIDVIALADLADIMAAAGAEGADVHHTLRARAGSLRDQIRSAALADAEVRTAKLDIPAAALITVVLVLIGYPFLTQLTVH